MVVYLKVRCFFSARFCPVRKLKKRFKHFELNNESNCIPKLFRKCLRQITNLVENLFDYFFLNYSISLVFSFHKSSALSRKISRYFLKKLLVVRDAALSQFKSNFFEMLPTLWDFKNSNLQLMHKFSADTIVAVVWELLLFLCT